MVNKYLIVLDFPNGMSDLGGVAVFFATSETEAKIKACSLWGLSDSAIMDMFCYVVDSLYDGWYH